MRRLIEVMLTHSKSLRMGKSKAGPVVTDNGFVLATSHVNRVDVQIIALSSLLS